MGSGSEITITFKNNGIVEGDFGGEKERSRYKVKGGSVTITDSDGSEYVYIYGIMKANGQTMLSLNSVGVMLTLYKV